jgi:hypothetical protein
MDVNSSFAAYAASDVNNSFATDSDTLSVLELNSGDRAFYDQAPIQ